MWVSNGFNGNTSDNGQHNGGNGTYWKFVDFRGVYRVHGVRRAGYPVHAKGVKMSKQEKAIMTRRTPREDLGDYMFITPSPFEYMRSLKHSDVRKIGRGKHG